MPEATPIRLNFNTRRALLFALTAERLSAFYEHGQWMTDKQGATLAQLWLSRSKLQLPLEERRLLSTLSDDFARELAGTLSREAGLYTAHEMTESLDADYAFASAVAQDLLEDCTRRLIEAGIPES
ncbi:hypothetical protein OYT13_00415 [Pandoraea sp. XJJ-1]|uniref:Uncharacterized protein n=2 Tax=Pandoraea cepalis TaxID=2508294 RepID=A0A5E4RAS8_9BURK|nr:MULTISPECIES: hypothetical protein [Pandoraea]OJY21172.1 MAG: hypothetical protein BGP02_19075 [Pandoraea sp. 64-18]WAL82993.1 hypothetical protein OYT13_00415 [Pandoraea sp. XJJ-1]BDD91838.1 hypothetical protein PanNE5_12780 [Pandoraea sp. NE5]VVD59612.1 hypothetical protein PCE31106_00027 [Pandoraea cepalis]